MNSVFKIILLLVGYCFAHDQHIAIMNQSSCGLRLVYSDSTPSIKNHSASKIIKSYSSGVIKANLPERASSSDMFVDQYVAHCQFADLYIYVIGHTKNWVSSMELNDYITFGGDSHRNVVGETIESSYLEENLVLIKNMS